MRPVQTATEALLAIVLAGAPATVMQGATLNCDRGQYRRLPGLEAHLADDALRVQWDGEAGQQLRAVFAIEKETAVIRELALRKKGREWSMLGRNLTPEFGVTTGIRRTNHGLSEEKRWDVFWDVPLNHTNEVRRFAASYRVDRCEVKTDGARLEVSFPGLAMGIFSGRLQFTVYRGANLLRQEAIAKTEEPSVAYKYEGGLKGFSTDILPRVAWHDVHHQPQTATLSNIHPGDQTVLRARNRLAVAEGQDGSIAVFPAPHQFFFARELEVNLGYVWYRSDPGNTFAMGVRHADHEEGYNPAWINGVFALYNAPPGTWQRMSVYYYLSPGDARACRESVLAYTRGDRYQPLEGYKTMVTHFHVAFTKELMDSGSLDTEPPWIPLMKDLGINIAHIFDFHGDGHPNDPGTLRLSELENYFAACRRHSDRDFLILPGEEANAWLGGHYNILFPRPVFWTHASSNARPFLETHPNYGTVYHTRTAEELFRLMQKEHALVWQTHPRTKGSTDYPDKIRDADYFRDDQWLGTAFKALPVDLSQKRLGEVRCFGTLDDMNNWGRPKYMVGEVDTYKKFPDYDLYGDFNVNYVKLARVPAFDDWSPINRALRAGEFFVTTGEILIPHWTVQGRGPQREVVAEVEWTFPLEFAEAVWGDGEKVGQEIVSATDQPPFGTKRFRIPFESGGKKWVRFAVWDSAGNGAFTQPVHLDH